MMRIPTIVAATAALALAGCAATQSDPVAATGSSSGEGGSCFFLSQVNGFNRGPDLGSGRDSIVVSVGLDEYLFETFGPCPDLDFSETIGFDQNGPGTICRGIDVDLIVPSTIGARRCPVRMIRKLSDSEAEAY